MTGDIIVFTPRTQQPAQAKSVLRPSFREEGSAYQLNCFYSLPVTIVLVGGSWQVVRIQLCADRKICESYEAQNVELLPRQVRKIETQANVACFVRCHEEGFCYVLMQQGTVKTLLNWEPAFSIRVFP